jgi:hypothetical protein
MSNLPSRTNSCASSLRLLSPRFELGDLDGAAVRGPDRRVTQMISEWAYMARDGEKTRYSGIRYVSRLGSPWECWAMFEDDELEIEVIERVPVTKDMPELREVADLFGLTVF